MSDIDKIFEKIDKLNEKKIALERDIVNLSKDIVDITKKVEQLQLDSHLHSYKIENLKNNVYDSHDKLEKLISNLD